LTQRYTRREVGRILGLDARRLRYWERLRLVRPQARWGERFYSFGDLVALQSIQRLTKKNIPARKLQRAVTLLEQQFGGPPLSVHDLRLVDQGREVVVIPPGMARPFNPLKRQWVLHFDGVPGAAKLRSMLGQTAEQLFETALQCEMYSDSLPQAAETYRRVVALAPDWIEAHINLGVAYYQMGQLEPARAAFRSAVELDPSNGISLYNLGCVLEEIGEVDEAITHLRNAARIMPTHADVHFNLALAYEKGGERRLARQQWGLYLRYAPYGPWAEQARARLKTHTSRSKRSRPIPFPRKAR
jgi:tetratricopeptide (TPR) repeat protein